MMNAFLLPLWCTPLLTWFVTGCFKFIINCLRAREWSLSQIGYGGFPSNHSAIMASSCTAIAIREGTNTPLFTLAIAITFIVIIDASGLRRQIGRQAQVINTLNHSEVHRLRERMGHTMVEIIGGLMVGTVCGWLFSSGVSTVI